MVKMPPGPSAYFDVDDTLIIWKDDHGKERNLPQVEVNCRGIIHKFYINPFNLDYLKKLANRGHAVILWSAGGADWAEAVGIALNIEHMVFAACSKPTYYVDDIQDPSKILGKYEFYDIDGKRILLEGK